MNNIELTKKVRSAMYCQCRRRGYTAPVGVLMEIGVLQKSKYEDWRFGRIPYLESVCTINLHKLSFIMHQMRIYAYKRWGVKKKNGQGHKPVIPLRLSKSGNPEVEKWYATHFVDSNRIKELNAASTENKNLEQEF